ncbi:UvrD-helicase domain-containing protein, partial [Klebsiella pneumoniae]|uniref:UvrD-helicase domain-containing protein n=1 Tax=Klebsiella pneumoniae TaxID=573 RepID=UPI003B986F10
SHARRTITDIKPTNILSEMTCISVDSDDKLFLTNHFIVTHNTRVLQKRVAYILANDIDPRRILTVTFTNKAAGEMKERIGQEVGEKLAKKIMIGTFHSLAVRWLHQYHNEAGLKKN